MLDAAGFACPFGSVCRKDPDADIRSGAEVTPNDIAIAIDRAQRSVFAKLADIIPARLFG
ncbi:MAG: hypothetical protein AAF729_09315 [Pseudomonadota bacterium]